MAAVDGIQLRVEGCRLVLARLEGYFGTGFTRVTLSRVLPGAPQFVMTIGPDVGHEPVSFEIPFHKPGDTYEALVSVDMAAERVVSL